MGVNLILTQKCFECSLTSENKFENTAAKMGAVGEKHTLD